LNRFALAVLAKQNKIIARRAHQQNNTPTHNQQASESPLLQVCSTNKNIMGPIAGHCILFKGQQQENQK
jgi:hypothetical protein